MKLDGQVVWITGASSGIGEACAHLFARAGARLVLSSRRTDVLEQVRQRCEHPEDHRVVPLDLAQSDSFDARVAQVVSSCGRIDVLINNAGIGQRALAMETTMESERRLMEVDYFGPVALTKAVLPVMLRQRAGRVVVISSVMGYLGTPGRSSYAAAKHALHGYFDSLRAEVWREGIGITLVCPGYVNTSLSENALRADGGRHGHKDARTARGISPEKCARAILRAVQRDREEVYVGGSEVAGVYLKRLAPWLVSRVVRRMEVPR